jgi:hypothetical protein
VLGKIKGMQQQLTLLNDADKRDLTPEAKFYERWSISVSGIDVLTATLKTATSTIVSHAYADGRHVVTCEPDLGVEFEMGTSKATLMPPKGSGGDKVLAVVGFHVYSSLQQILTVKDLSKESAAMSDTDGYYSGYKVEVWEGDVLLAQQRVHDFVAKSGTFIFKGALAATGTRI